MELYRETRSGLDLQTEREVLRYTYSGAEPREIIVRVNAGDLDNPLSGLGGEYLLAIYLDGVKVVPDSATTVDTGRTRWIAVSRPIAIESGDIVTATIRGLTGDVGITVISSLRDATPLREDEVFGTGSVVVDHDYPTEGDLVVQNSSTGASVEGVKIMAYLASQYAAGQRGASFIRGQSVTDVNGRWQNPMLLSPETYMLTFSRPDFLMRTVELTVI